MSYLVLEVLMGFTNGAQWFIAGVESSDDILEGPQVVDVGLADFWCRRCRPPRPRLHSMSVAISDWLFPCRLNLGTILWRL